MDWRKCKAKVEVTLEIRAADCVSVDEYVKIIKRLMTMGGAAVIDIVKQHPEWVCPVITIDLRCEP